jgi:hypothetical protein
VHSACFSQVAFSYTPAPFCQGYFTFCLTRYELHYVALTLGTINTIPLHAIDCVEALSDQPSFFDVKKITSQHISLKLFKNSGLGEEVEGLGADDYERRLDLYTGKISLEVFRFT